MADFKETQKSYTQAKVAFKQATANLYLARQEYHLWETKREEFLKAASLASLPGGS